MIKLFRVFKTLKSSHKYFLVQYIRDYFIIIQINGLFFNTLEIILLCNVLSHYLLHNLQPASREIPGLDAIHFLIHNNIK